MTRFQNFRRRLARHALLTGLVAGMLFTGGAVEARAQYIGGDPPETQSRNRADREFVYDDDHQEYSDHDEYGDPGIDYGWFYNYDTEGWHDGDYFESDNYFVVPGRGIGRYDEFYDEDLYETDIDADADMEPIDTPLRTRGEGVIDYDPHLRGLRDLDDGAAVPSARVITRDYDSVNRLPAAGGRTVINRGAAPRHPAPAVVTRPGVVAAPLPRRAPPPDTLIVGSDPVVEDPDGTVRSGAYPSRMARNMELMDEANNEVESQVAPGVTPPTARRVPAQLDRTDIVKTAPGEIDADLDSRGRDTTGGRVMIDHDEPLDAEAADPDYDDALFDDDLGQGIDDDLSIRNGRVEIDGELEAEVSDDLEEDLEAAYDGQTQREAEDDEVINYGWHYGGSRDEDFNRD